jgi:hypothetical protein
MRAIAVAVLALDGDTPPGRCTHHEANMHRALPGSWLTRAITFAPPQVGEVPHADDSGRSP